MSLPDSGGEPDLEQQFVASLPLVERILQIIARRHALSSGEAEEFGAWAKARLVGANYAVFRKFGGRSSLATYLTAVLSNLFRDFRNSHWGRWRPSAAARRLGPVAIRLEELLHRDGYPLREAIELLHSAGVRLDDVELARLAVQLPDRPGIEVSLDGIGEAVPLADCAVDPPVESDTVVAALRQALERLVAELPPEDALILRMRFWNDMTVADIARALRLDQKSLYRRLDAIAARLRIQLEARGIDRKFAAEVLGENRI